MEASQHNEESSNMDGVAIVGMALRVPGAVDTQQFWENLRQGVESTTFFSDEELRLAGVPESVLLDPSYVKACGVLEGTEQFDAGFFDMLPREAEILDPQHRHFLECAWEALENAGYGPGTKAAIAARIGLFGGVGLNGYLLHNIATQKELIESMGGWQITLGNDKDFAATRAAYKLDLRGAALNISTACSTSLVSVAMGCQSLLSYQCDMIVAGGCSIHLPQDQGYWFQTGGTLSPDGHCRAFDAQAQGTFDGNGAAMVVLKRLEDAIADGDTIHGVIRGFAVNNDGALKVGFTAPSVEGQSSVILEAQEMADISADTIAYVETHGTGTDLGDLVEVTALTEAFRSAGVTENQQCGIGSVKTNVGHLDTASGTTSLIKTVLGLSHGQIPPSLHFTQANPKLGLETSPFYVNAKLRDWPRLKGAPRRGGVSSFGIGGTNAHLVVEEAPAVLPSDAGRVWKLLPVSARSSVALDNNVNRLVAHLREQPDVELADAAYTLQLGRRAFSQRLAVLATHHEGAITTLEAASGNQVFSGSVKDQAPAVVFMFPGQDAQYVGMAKTLYRDEPLFRKEVDQCAEILRNKHGIDLIALLFPANSEADTEFASNPLPLFVVEYALARVWLALGVQMRAMMGYSLGEYVCACLAGVFSLEDALTLSIAGARLLALLKPGPLLAVSLSETELRPLIGAGLGISMISAPRQCVVGGSAEAVAELKLKLAATATTFVDIPLGLPFHTEFMEPFLAPYRAELQKVRFSAPKIPFVSCVTGDWIRPEEAIDPEHYLRLASQTVYLAQGFEQLFSVADAIFLEVGPGQTMSSFAMLQNTRPANLEVLSSLRDSRYSMATELEVTDLLSLHTAIAKMWIAGVDIDWSTLYVDERRQRVPMPTYAFEHKRYWVEAKAIDKSLNSEPENTGKLQNPEEWFYLPRWRECPPLPKTKHTGKWLVLGAHSGLAPSLAKSLSRSGAEVTVCCSGRNEASGEPMHFELTKNLTNIAAWDALFDRTEQDGKPFDHIIYLVLLDRVADSDEDTLLDIGFNSMLALGQSLSHRVFSESVNIVVIADGVLAAGDAVLSPAKAAAIGPLLVLPQEYSNLHCKVIDVNVPEVSWQRDRLLDELIAEFASVERAVALHSGRRWVEKFEAYPLAAPLQKTEIFQAGGVYLITGGLGNVGLALAQHIAQRAADVHLVLTTRQNTPPSGKRLQQVQLLESMGAKVRVAVADVCDEQVMTALVTDIEQQFGPLNGVIHAAGLVGQESFATVSDSSAEFCMSQFKPKLNGARILEKVLADRPLDFCMLCSSLSSILGGLGFAAYAAANASMDSFVINHNRRHPTRWVSILWEGWDFDEDSAEVKVGAALAELGLEPAEGSDAFERIISASHTDVVVLSSGNLAHRIRQWVEFREPQSESVTPPQHSRSALLGEYIAPSGVVEVEVARLWEALLGISGISALDSFFELGGNSLLLTQLLAKIRKAFRVELSLAALFERPTITESARLIEETRASLTTLNEEDREEGLL